MKINTADVDSINYFEKESITSSMVWIICHQKTFEPKKKYLYMNHFSKWVDSNSSWNTADNLLAI